MIIRSFFLCPSVAVSRDKFIQFEQTKREKLAAWNHCTHTTIDMRQAICKTTMFKMVRVVLYLLLIFFLSLVSHPGTGHYYWHVCYSYLKGLAANNSLLACKAAHHIILIQMLEGYIRVLHKSCFFKSKNTIHARKHQPLQRALPPEEDILVETNYLFQSQSGI